MSISSKRYVRIDSSVLGAPGGPPTVPPNPYPRYDVTYRGVAVTFNGAPITYNRSAPSG